MSLIKCIECGKDISDKSKICKNCGCPTSESIKELLYFEYKCKNCNGTEYTKIENQGGIFLVCDKCGYVDEVVPRRQSQFEKDILKCPTCGSTSITAGQRGYTLLTGFLGSNKTVNRCANCGHTWKPGK